MTVVIKLPHWECLRCGHVWIPRVTHKPAKCASCRSPFWDRPARKKAPSKS